ncbi:MAG TPA: type II toxin-antitoxin system VapC family toxin [Ilumatobacteraceae bacterium]|nr:type II toxin-antitoxin system VapC family toxin [Ilumatobacteraceae bacterium]
MTGALVVDASFVMALLTDSDDAMTAWARDLIDGADLVAPHLMPVEVTRALRNAERRELVTPEQAALTHEDLIDLDVELHPFEPFASRVWALRHAVSPYDAWYVALAERLDAPLVTLDRRLARTADARCELTFPPS